MKCRIWTVFLTGLLALWIDHGYYCQAQRAQTKSGHKHSELPGAESNGVVSNRPPGKNGTIYQSAAKEQRYYLLQLFRHYGENGKLSFEGLHKLLTNLGLGEVQVVEIEHEGLGHDHVSHLDVLDLQENKHVHSHTALDHITAPTKDGEGHSVGPHRLELSVESSTTTSTLMSAQRRKRRSLLPTLGRRGAPQSHGEERLEPRSAAGRSEGVQRRQVEVTESPFTPARDGFFNHSKYNHLHGNCLNVSQLLVNFGMSTVHEITPKQFAYICPALLYQIDSRVCIHHHDWLGVRQEGRLSKSVWLWGFAAITLISLTSLLAVAIIPFLTHSFSKALLPFLVALAVGTLSADALLHLIPHAQDHRHKIAEDTGSRPLLDGKDSLWKGLSALGGIYLLFLLENLLGLFRNCGRGVKPMGKRQQKDLAGLQMDDQANIELRCLKPAQEDRLKVTLSGFEHAGPRSRVELDEVAPCGHFTHQTTSETGKGPQSDDSNDPPSGVRELEEQDHACGHFHGHSHAVHDIKDSGIVSIAWMVVMGDGVHNFTDGLAIGAAFSTGISGGLSTTIAVFCHELPHELGDFAVLMQAGMKVRQAVTFNLVSALLSYLGMVLGIAAGQYTYDVTPWIFTSTAGMFLYIALVDMLPGMLRGPSNTRRQGHLGHFMSKNMGFLLGVGVMLCIALFEDRLQINISS